MVGPTILLFLRSDIGGCNQGQRRLKRSIFRPLRKTDSDDADVTCCGAVFQTRAAATGKARSLIVDNRV